MDFCALRRRQLWCLCLSPVGQEDKWDNQLRSRGATVSRVIPSNTNVASWGSGVEQHQVKSFVCDSGHCSCEKPREKRHRGQTPSSLASCPDPSISVPACYICYCFPPRDTLGPPWRCLLSFKSEEQSAFSVTSSKGKLGFR